MPRSAKTRAAPRPAVRDPRSSDFACSSTLALNEQGFPCVVADGGGGLACYAARNIRAGEQVLVERPLVLTISHDARPHTCAHCLADSRNDRDSRPGTFTWSIRCEGCGTQRYCSDACAEAAAPRHRGFECAALARSTSTAIEEEDIDTVFQAVRILSDRNRCWQTDCGPAGMVGHGNSYAERLVGITPCTEEARAAIRRITEATLAVMPPDAPVPSASTLHDLLERHSCNLYGITGVAGEDVAGASFVGFFHLL